MLPLVVDATAKAVRNLEITTGDGALLAANGVAVSETEKRILNAKERLPETNVRIDEGEAIIARLEEKLAQLREEAKTLRVKAGLVEVLKEKLPTFETFYESLDRDDQRNILHLPMKRTDVSDTEYRIQWAFDAPPAVISRAGEGKEDWQDVGQQIERRAGVRRKKTLTRNRKAGSKARNQMVEIGRLELPTSCMPCRRSPS